MSEVQVIYRMHSGRVWVGAECVDLKDPAVYAAGVQKNVATSPNHFCEAVRVVDRATGEAWGDPLPCPYCDVDHTGPYTGLCLL